MSEPHPLEADHLHTINPLDALADAARYGEGAAVTEAFAAYRAAPSKANDLRVRAALAGLAAAIYRAAERHAVDPGDTGDARSDREWMVWHHEEAAGRIVSDLGRTARIERAAEQFADDALTDARRGPARR